MAHETYDDGDSGSSIELQAIGQSEGLASKNHSVFDDGWQGMQNTNGSDSGFYLAQNGLDTAELDPESGSDFEIPVLRGNLGNVSIGNVNGSRDNGTPPKAQTEQSDYPMLTADEMRVRLAKRRETNDLRPLRLHITARELEQTTDETVKDLYNLLCEEYGRGIQVVCDDPEAGERLSQKIHHARALFFQDSPKQRVSEIRDRLAAGKRTTINHMSWKNFSSDVVADTKKMGLLKDLKSLFLRYPQLLSFRESADYAEFQQLCQSAAAMAAVQNMIREMRLFPVGETAAPTVVLDEDVQASDADGIVLRGADKRGFVEVFETPKPNITLGGQIATIRQRLADGKTVRIPDLKQAIRQPENTEHLDAFVRLYREHPGKIVLGNPDDQQFIETIAHDAVTLALADLPQGAEGQEQEDETYDRKGNGKTGGHDEDPRMQQVINMYYGPKSRTKKSPVLQKVQGAFATLGRMFGFGRKEPMPSLLRH